MLVKKSIKAQAALEFLTTYGWAFLVILIMIGALAYFGILSPSRILPNRCNIGSEFQCIDYQISGSAQTVRLRLKSNLGEAITLPAAPAGISVGTEGTASLYCSTAVIPALPLNMKTGETVDFLFSTCANAVAAGLSIGDKGKVNITLNYYPTSSGPNYVKQIKGEIYASVS